jgi:hypothetical protein
MPLPPKAHLETYTAYLRSVELEHPDQYPAALRAYGVQAAAEGWWTRTFDFTPLGHARFVLLIAACVALAFWVVLSIN